MKLIRLLLAFTAFLVVNTISAQTNVTVNGHLTDISTSTLVPNHYVSVFVHPYSLGVAPYYADSVLTNSVGFYSFDFTLPTPADSLFVLKVGTFECNGNWEHKTFDNTNGQTNFSADLYICDSIYQNTDCYCAIEWPSFQNLTVTLHGYTWPATDFYSWDLGDGTYATGQDVTHTYSSPQRYIIGLTTTNFPDSCTFSTFATVDLSTSSDCESSFTTTPGDDLYTLYFSSNTTSQYSTNYTWSFGDGTNGSGQFIYHTFGSFGTYMVTLTSLDSMGCSFIYSAYVTVSDSINSGCESSFATTQGNDLYAINFQATTTSQYPTEFSWSFGDGTSGTGQSISHNYAAIGIYQVTLNSFDSKGCVSVYTENVWVADTIVNPPSNCGNYISHGRIGLTVFLTGFLWSGQPATYFWDMGDGSTYNGQFVTHTYAHSGTYLVKMQSITPDSCVDITIEPQFVSDSCKNTIIAHGYANLTMLFWGHIENGYEYTASYFWDWGDGTISTGQYPLEHKFSQPGIYNVVLKTITTDSCVDFTTYTCTLIDSIPNGCHSYFTATAGSNLYQIHFEGSTTSPYPATFMWDFGDPASGANNSSTLQNPDHTFSSASTYQVTLTIIDSIGCSSAFSAPVILSMFSQYNLYGQVFAGSQAITACKVQLFSQDYTGNMNLIREVVPDSADFYKFDSVSSGIYHILAIPDPGTIYSQQYLPTYFGDAFLWENSIPIVLGQPANPYHIHLANFDSVSGGDGLINGGLTTGGKSIDVGNQEILILDINNIPVKYMFSQADGSFSFEGLPYGEYKIYPVITGIKTYPVTVILSETNKSATVIMKISGQSVAGKNYVEISDLIENIYPNPTSAEIFISMKTNGAIKIQIIDVSGKIVLSKDENSIESGELFSLSLKELLNGLYLIVIRDDKGNTSSRRIIKN